jgi:hypothetical protein
MVRVSNFVHSEAIVKTGHRMNYFVNRQTGSWCQLSDVLCRLLDVSGSIANCSVAPPFNWQLQRQIDRRPLPKHRQKDKRGGLKAGRKGARGRKYTRKEHREEGKGGSDRNWKD